MLDFGIPSAPGGLPNGAQNPPSGAKRSILSIAGINILASLFVDRFRNAPGDHFDRFVYEFGMDLTIIFDIIFIDFGTK